MTADQQKAVTNSPGGAKLSERQRLAYLEQKLKRYLESQEKSDRKHREWIAEIKGEIEDLKSSLVS